MLDLLFVFCSNSIATNSRASVMFQEQHEEPEQGDSKDDNCAAQWTFPSSPGARRTITICAWNKNAGEIAGQYLLFGWSLNLEPCKFVQFVGQNYTRAQLHRSFVFTRICRVLSIKSKSSSSKQVMRWTSVVEMTPCLRVLQKQWSVTDFCSLLVREEGYLSVA